MSNDWKNNHFYSSKCNLFFHIHNFSNLPFTFPKVYASDENELPLLDYKQKIKDYMSKETGDDRLRKMFSKNEHGLMNPEISYIIRGCVSCIIAAAVFGGMTGFGQAKADFLRKNVDTQFESEFLARRKLSDQMTLGALRGAFKNAVKIGGFSSAYLFTTMTAATYNNKITPYEHIATGALLGSISRINYGLRGVAVAGCLGSFLGLISGGIILLLMKATGVSFEELRYWQHETYWNQFYTQSLTEARTKKNYDDTL